MGLLALLSVVATAWAGQWEFADTPAVGLAAVLVQAGFSVTAALLWNEEHQRGNAWLFTLLAAVWLVGRLTYTSPGAATCVFYWVGTQLEVVAAAALLRYPSGRLEPINRLFILVVGAGLGIFSLLILLVSTPTQLGLADIPWPTILENPDASLWARAATTGWISAGAIVFLVLLTRRWFRMAPLERRTLAPIMVTALFVGVSTTPYFLTTFLSVRGDEPILLVRSYGAVAVGVAFVVSAIQMRMARASLVTLVNRLRIPATGSEVQAALREVLLDERLEVVFTAPDGGGWIDGEGHHRDATVPVGRMPITTTTDAGAASATILVDARLDRYRTLLDAAVTVSQFALENARLEAGLRAQLIAVREARARLLSAGLQQRRQLERDLHDGAQQRLLAIGLRLGALEASVHDDPRIAESVQLVRKELHVALDELRDLARGIYPAVLSQSGLAPALEAVVERFPLRTELSVPSMRWEPDVESAAYLVVCEALANAARHAGDCTVRVGIGQKSDGLHVRVVDDGAGSDLLAADGALDTLRDRVAALGGQLKVSSSPGAGTLIEAVLPCA